MTAPGTDRRSQLRLLKARRRQRRIRSSRANRLVLLGAIKQIPSFARLLLGLARDKRVALVDKLMVVGALAYLFMPADLVPDLVPFMGLVDDIFLLAAAIRRLIRNAGFKRALLYWHGDPADLRRLRIEKIIRAAASFLPRRIRERLTARM